MNRDAQILFRFTVCYLPRAAGDPFQDLDAVLADRFPNVQRVEHIEGTEQELSVAARVADDPLRSLAHPDEKLLREFCRWLSPDEAASLKGSEQALVLDWSYPSSRCWPGLQTAVALTHALAEDAGALIRDETTREFFSPATWREQRGQDGDANSVPDAAAHTMIHAYKRDNSLRAVTLGMRKFGLPDLAVRGFAPAVARNVGQLINLTAQALVEGAATDADGLLQLDMHGIQNADVREAHLSNLLSGAAGSAPLVLREVEADSGVDLNTVLEILFERGDGDEARARQRSILSALFGSKPEPMWVEHNEALQVASNAARERLPGLRRQFEDGLPPGASMFVKAPFPKPDAGREWMWVEVAAWNDEAISGVLVSEPSEIPNLQAGQPVKIRESDVFDYILRRADGSAEGNETGRVMQQLPN